MGYWFAMTARRFFYSPLLQIKRMFLPLAGGLLPLGLLTAVTPSTYGQTLSLVWSDEFNSASTNVDSTKWVFESGNNGGWGNNELEFYTDRTNNAYVANGLLHIHAQQENTNGFRFTSARMKTQGLFWTLYGRIEWRAKLPAGVGMWPALWMMGTNIVNTPWPGCGEIDVVENNGATITFEQGSIHSGSDATKIFNFSGSDSVTNFHVYDLDWDTNSIIWSVDGVPYETQTSWSSSTGKPYPFPFNQPFFLLMNLATGGNYVGNPSTNSINPSLPNEMQVDYVRVYNSIAPTQAPAAPTGLVATPVGASVSLTWDVVSNATSYFVKRATTMGGPYTTNANPTVTAYTDTNVTNCTTYYYVVSAVNSFGESTNSVEATASVAGSSIAVAPASNDFGTIATGSTAQFNFVVTNQCGGTLSGTAVVGGAPFTIASGSPFSVPGESSTNVVVVFTPSSTGSFTDNVIFVTNSGNSTNPITGTGAIAPVPSFSGTPTAGPVPLIVAFTDTSTGTVTSRVWAFGDGGTSTLASPSHSYTNAGSYSVSLTVLGPFGSNTLLLADYITVTNVFGAPVAAFTANPVNGAAPLPVNFTDASTGTITNHLWNFGDGNFSTLNSPSHTYSNAGIYSVTLTVLGPGGSGITNRVNLITVTNALNTSPTVMIIRPANSMLYPPAFTNQTITIVANATSNDGGAISKIEFFDGNTLIGETNSSPATNLLVHPALGVHVISARASETFGTTNISSATTITVGARNSPLGDWEVTISGADKGAQFLTFEDDFSASGFGIRLKTFGLDDVSGQWGITNNNPKGQVTGSFVEQTGATTNWTGTLLGPVRSSKSMTGTVKTSPLGTMHWRGIPATTLSDLSGTWTGLVTVVRTTPAAVSYVLGTNANDSAVFDIATSEDPGTVVGQLLVTSRNKVYAYVTFDGKQLRLSGTFSTVRRTLTLRGTDATAETVSVKVLKQQLLSPRFTSDAVPYNRAGIAEAFAADP